jgi:hypothetical protein
MKKHLFLEDSATYFWRMKGALTPGGQKEPLLLEKGKGLLLEKG